MAVHDKGTTYTTREGTLNYAGLETVRTNLITAKGRFIKKWEDAAKLVSPYRYRVSPADDNAGERKDYKIFRNTAGRALRIYVSGMMNGNTPRSRPWFRLTTLDQDVSLRERKTLSLQSDIIDRFFHISNLYKVLPGVYEDLGVFSNACFAMLPHPKTVFHFYPISVGQYCIGADAFGNVNTFVRDYSMTVRQLVEKFGKLTPSGHVDLGSLNSWVREMYVTKQYEQRIVITNLIVPNQNAKRRPILPLDRPFHSYHYINQWGPSAGVPIQTWPNERNARLGMYGSKGQPSKGMPENKDDFILQVSGYDYFPIIAPRWQTLPDEAYGVGGPMDLAHSDVLTLQKEQEYRLEAIAKMARPPFIGPANLAGRRVSTAAGGITYYSEMSDKQLRPLFQVDGKIGELIRSIEETDKFIGESFFVDLFKAVAQYDPKSHVSAAEIQKRAAESLQLVSPVLSQLDEDMNEKVIGIAHYLLRKQGLMPELENELGSPMIPEFISPLAQATKVSQATTIERAVNFTASASDAFQMPALKKILNEEAIVRRYLQVLGVNPMDLRDEQEYEQEVIKIQEAEAQQMQKQDQMDEASMMKDMSQAKLEGDSVLDRLQNQEQEAA